MGVPRFLPWRDEDRRRVQPRILGPDALRFWLTGAASDGGVQADPDASLGNFRSATESRRVGMIFSSPIPGITILMAARINGADGVTGSLQAPTADRLIYAAPSGVPGPAITILNGQTRTLWDGADPSKWIRVTRTSANPLAGAGMVEFTDVFYDVFGMLPAPEAESSAGGDRYRAVILRAEEPVASLTLSIPGSIDTGGIASGTSTVTGLPAAGAGTITAIANSFLDWPTKGWCKVSNAIGVLKEVVYYSSRTDTVLTVPALGRARLGTVATAGVIFDLLVPVPGIRIGTEVPVAGAIQTIANEMTAPVGITWSVGSIAAGSLSGGQMLGLWVHRELPAGVSAYPKVHNRIRVSFLGADAATYGETLAGMFRIADDQLERYELHIGVGAPPDITLPPTETFTSLPFTTVTTLGVGTTNYLVVNRRNRHDMRSESDVSTIIRVDGAGDQVAPLPTAPEVVQWVAGLGGAFLLTAVYFYDVDSEANQADSFLIYTRFDGSDPDPSIDIPVVVAMIKSDGGANLLYTTAVQPPATTGKVIVRVRRTGPPIADSNNLDVHTAVNDAAGGGAPVGGIFWRKVAEEEQ
jgi:hypothetical protein